MQIGLDFEMCEDADLRRKWFRPTNEGRQKIFTVRKVHNDISFVDEFVNQEFAEDQKMFVYGFNKATREYEIVSRDWQRVKKSLLDSLTNFGNPIIQVADANYENRGELYLHHEWVGQDLQFDYAQKTLEYVQSMWKRPVWLETREEGKGKVFHYDGTEHRIVGTEGSTVPPDTAGQGA